MKVLLVSISLLLFASNSMSQVNTIDLGTYQDWNSRSAEHDGQKLCYSTSKTSKGSTIFITNMSSSGSNILREPSLQLNTSAKPGSKLSAKSISNTYDFFTSGSGAWLEDGYDYDEFINDVIINNGISIQYTNTNYEIIYDEISANGLSDALKKCSPMFVTSTPEVYQPSDKKIVTEEEKLDLKKNKIASMKKDCEDLGFKNDTEAMGNCVLKLMELEGKNFNSSGSNSSNEIVDIEKQKLQAQREALSLQQDQLKAEQERVAQERRKAIQRNANKSIRQGQCLMNGGSTWDCM